MQELIRAIDNTYIKKDTPYFVSGDTVRVDVRIVEEDSERIQAFEGVVIARKNSGVNETFTVRKVSYGTGIERTFFINSPIIGKIAILKRGKVRRAKLYYLREKFGKSARIQERKPVTNQAKTTAKAE